MMYSSPEEYLSEHGEIIPPIDRDYRDREAVETPDFEITRGCDAPLDTSCKNYIVKGQLSYGDVAAIQGPPGSGKTFVALHYVRSISAGADVLGHRTKQTPVLYITLEGAEGFKKRVYALEQRFSPDDAFFYACCRATDFQNKAFVAKVIKTIADHKIGVVVYDTLSRLLSQHDENTGQGMGFATGLADEVSRKTRAANLFVAHTGKDPTKGLRGHSSIIGAVDLEIGVQRDESGQRLLTLRKVKDGPDGLSYAFDLKTVDLGEDDEGDPIVTCIATGFTRTDPEGAHLTLTEQKWFDGISEFFASGGGKYQRIFPHDTRQFQAAKVSEIRDCFQRIGICPGAPDSGDNPETNAEQKKRERANSIALSKWAGALRRKGKIGYENGLIWLLEGSK